MALPALPTEDEIREAARSLGYLDNRFNAGYDPEKRRKLMNVALELRKTRTDATADLRKRHVVESVEQDLHGSTVDRLHDFYQDALVAFDDDDRAFALVVAVAPALVTRSGLHTTDSEGTAHRDDTTDEESTREEGDAGERELHTVRNSGKSVGIDLDDD